MGCLHWQREQLERRVEDAAANAEDEGADAAAAAEATKRSASALLLCHGPERDMLERKIGMLLDYLGAQPAGAQAAGPQTKLPDQALFRSGRRDLGP